MALSSSRIRPKVLGSQPGPELLERTVTGFCCPNQNLPLNSAEPVSAPASSSFPPSYDLSSPHGLFTRTVPASEAPTSSPLSASEASGSLCLCARESTNTITHLHGTERAYKPAQHETCYATAAPSREEKPNLGNWKR